MATERDTSSDGEHSYSKERVSPRTSTCQGMGDIGKDAMYQARLAGGGLRYQGRDRAPALVGGLQEEKAGEPPEGKPDHASEHALEQGSPWRAINPGSLRPEEDRHHRIKRYRTGCPGEW